jgi:hypothetical protein
MNKRQLHHLWTKFRLVKPWYFLILALIWGVIAVFALRANNQQMVELRQAVYVADQRGSDVQEPLRQLQAYVTTHMNTNLNAGQSAVYPPIQLKYTYERLVKARGDETAKANSQLYSAAQALCEQQNPAGVSGRNRIPCIEQYVQSHNPQQAPIIPDALYKFAFTSPSWSPDLAGWSLVLAVLSGLLFVAALVVRFWFRHSLA